MSENLLFVPNPYVLVPSPYLIAPSAFQINNPLVILVAVFEEITSEEQNQDLIQTVTGRQLLQYHKAVVGEFYRQNIDAKFPHWKLKRNERAIIKPEVEIWKAVLTMLEQIHLLKPLTRYPALMLRDLILERNLMVLNFACLDGQVPVKNYLARLQQQNRKLRGSENPFAREESPYAWEIITQAITFAKRDHQFRLKFYTPVVRARETFVALMKSEKYRIFNQGKIQRQGRKEDEDSQDGKRQRRDRRKKKQVTFMNETTD
ncbi:hypothetical protein NIES2098_61880 [Calothrix sp. NIES-2098]|nr:hypothetical protein NIES2098_61880 [Calothrix sp. NIES-2098]